MSEQLLGWVWKPPEVVVSQDALGRPSGNNANATLNQGVDGDGDENDEEGSSVKAIRRTVAGAITLVCNCVY